MRQPHPELNFGRGRGWHRITAADVRAVEAWLYSWDTAFYRYSRAMAARTL